ncbi:MAG: hypothetical protein OEM96_03800 [Gemmatimonadota bacterium]|nr:hypothetical protein [Gemmatimonadota bacterium]
MTRDTRVIESGTQAVSWGVVMRDVLEFQFKLVVDGFKDLALAQVALGAAVVDFIRRDGSPGRRFYGIVRLSDRFDRWIDLHAAEERAPGDTPDFAALGKRSVDDVLGGVESSARRVARTSTRLSRRAELERA